MCATCARSAVRTSRYRLSCSVLIGSLLDGRVCRGCGSSSNASSQPVGKAASPKGGKQSPTGAAAGTPKGQHELKADAIVPVPATPPVEKKQLIGRESRNGTESLHGQAVHAAVGGPTGVTCDSNHAHPATVWCRACETNLCDEDDARIHALGGKHEHHLRTVLATGEPRKHTKHEAGGAPPHQPTEPTGKFVIRENPAPSKPSDHPAHPHHHGDDSPAHAQAGSPHHAAASPGSAEKAKYTVAQFHPPPSNNHASSGASSASPAGSAAPHVSSHGASDRVQRSTSGTSLNQITQAQLSALSGPELDALWKRYDKNMDGVLQRAEVKALADDVIHRVIQLVKEDLQRQHPDISAADLHERVEEEKLFRLPGKSEAETAHEMKRRLAKTLDLNQDGKITKTEYVMQWNAFADGVFTEQKTGELGCSIM